MCSSMVGGNRIWGCGKEGSGPGKWICANVDSLAKPPTSRGSGILYYSNGARGAAVPLPYTLQRSGLFPWSVQKYSKQGLFTQALLKRPGFGPEILICTLHCPNQKAKLTCCEWLYISQLGCIVEIDGCVFSTQCALSQTGALLS